jgi:hypothetical protein
MHEHEQVSLGLEGPSDPGPAPPREILGQEMRLASHGVLFLLYDGRHIYAIPARRVKNSKIA